MRISSKSLQMQWLATVREQQARVARLQEQVSSGSRITSAVDDPIGAAQVALFRQGLDRLETYGVNADTVERRLRLEEASLNEASDVLNRARELALQAGGAAAATPEARAAIAVEVEELLLNLVDIANSQDGEGRYLFAGNRVQTKPFERVNGQVVYAGDQGTRTQRIADDRLVRENDPGSAVFQLIRDGNGTFSVAADAANTGNLSFTSASVIDAGSWPGTDFRIRFTAPDRYDLLDSGGSPVTVDNPYNAGDAIAFSGAVIGFSGEPAAGDEFLVRTSRNQDAFASLQGLVDALATDTAAPEQRALFQSRLNASLMNLDRALDNVNAVRSEVGARLNAVDSQRQVNEEVAFQLETGMSNVRDLDYADAISELQLRLRSLEAAEKSYAQTRRISLFDFI